MKKIKKITKIKEVKIKELDKNCDLFLGNGITIEILKDTPFASDYSCKRIVKRAISYSYQNFSDKEEVNYEFFKKCFHFNVQKLYDLYK